MSAEQGKNTAFHGELAKVEAIAGLRHAVDSRHRRFVQLARADWERLFGGKDPADACVSVRVAAKPIAIQTSAVRGSGFLKSRRQSHAREGAKSSLPRFAH